MRHIERQVIAGALIVIAMLSLVHLNALPSLSGTTLCRPGAYVEYVIKNATAYSEVINVCPEVLVNMGLMYRYEVSDCIVYADSPLTVSELREMLERGLLGRCCNVILSKRNLYSQVREAALRGDLPFTVSSPCVLSLRLTLFEVIEAKYYWRVIEVRNDTLAVVEVGFVGRVMRPLNRREEFVNSTFRVLLDLNSRIAYTLDGKSIGVVPYWITGGDKGSVVLLCSVNSILINGTIYEESRIVTPFGAFNVYCVRSNATLWTPSISRMAFDKRTGLLVSAREYVDPVLRHFMRISGIRAREFTLSKASLPRAIGEFSAVSLALSVGLMLALVAVLAIQGWTTRRRRRINCPPR